MDSTQLTPWLLLQSIDGVGDRTLLKLVQACGSPARALAASLEDLMRAGCSADLAEVIRRGPPAHVRHVIDRQVQLVERLGIQVIALTDPSYPKRLRMIHDPPPLLYCTGALHEQDGMAVAIVGGRSASPAGRASTEEIAEALARNGWTVVSGLARGIDAAAHRGALAGQGRTIAVLGCGADQTYPPEHDRLRAQIEEHGAVLTELPLGAPPQSHHFPRRNRIISGLSVGVLVAEAAMNSGSLITAKLALEQGREVFALPGSVKEACCRGSNGLIKAGAKLVDCAADIMEELLPQVEPALRAHATVGAMTAPMRAGEGLGADEQRIVEMLSHDAQSVDAVIERTGLSAAQVSAAMLALELRGYVRQLPGPHYVRR
ncbi:MAG: Rossmann fold nucleotide-binding protein Smf [Nitrospira sp.]|nr:MAG: Rossmann fold nucleotide-binding protein Smf [Nitrospira sp.]